jgi:urease accessory protein
MLRLLHLSDSLFPIGGFAYSDGLESATASGAIVDGNGLRVWLEVTLDEIIGRMEGPAAWRAYLAFADGEWETLAALDAELTALRPSSTARLSSRAMGSRLLTTWQALYPDPRLERLQSIARIGAIGPTLPVAFAAATASAELGQRPAIEAFAYTRLAATISAAMRLMPLGQSCAHALLARMLARIPSVVDRISAGGDPPESFTPRMDIASMTQQYLRTRLFRS